MNQDRRGQDPRQGGPRSSCALAYAALPHDLVEDTRLTSTDVRVAAELLKFARNKDHCWPGAETIGKAIGRKKRAVQMSLARLEATGWIERVWRYRPTPASPKRRVRVIVLRWRCDPLFDPPAKRAPDCTREMSGFAPHVAQPVALESENRIVEGVALNENAGESPISQRFDSEPSAEAVLPELATATPAAAAPAEALSGPATAPPALSVQPTIPTAIAAAPAALGTILGARAPLALPAPRPTASPAGPPRSFEAMARRVMDQPTPAPCTPRPPASPAAPSRVPAEDERNLVDLIASQLGAEAASRWGTLSAGKRAELATCYQMDAGDRLVFWTEARRALCVVVRPPVPGKDATLEELIASLRQHSGDFGLVARTAAAIRDTLGDLTGYRWLVSTLQGVQDRTLDPEAVIGPLLRTLKAVEAPGSKVKNPAAYFNRALQNEVEQRQAEQQSMGGS